MGFLDYLSPGLTAASTAVTGYQNAKADESRQQMLDAIAMRKQQQADSEQAVRMRLQEAQVGVANANRDFILGAKTTAATAGANAAGKQVVVGPDGTVTVVNKGTGVGDVVTDPEGDNVQGHVAPAPHIDPLSPEGIAAAAKKAKALEPFRTSKTTDPFDTPQSSASRRDLKDTQSQQVRAENAAKALKSEQRALATDHPRASKPLADQRTAADSALARQYQGMGSQITAASDRAGKLTQRADSILNVIPQQRKHGPNAESYLSHLDDTITDDELHDAMQHGAMDEDSVRQYVAAARGGS